MSLNFSPLFLSLSNIALSENEDNIVLPAEQSTRNGGFSQF